MSTTVNDDATFASGPFEPSSPHYSPDSEAPSDVKSTFTSETEEYEQSQFSNEIDDIDSLPNDLPSTGTKRDHLHDYWQSNLNHPVDMPNKRQKIQSLQSIAIPATVFMAIDTTKEKPLAPIFEADATSEGGTPHAEATLGDNYIQDLHNISISRDFFVPSARAIETTQLDEEHSPDEEMPEPRQDFPFTVEGIKLSPTMVNTKVEVSELDRKITVKMMPHITERVNKIDKSLSHDSLDSILATVLPETKAWINSSVEGASTPLTAFYLSKEIAYYRRYLQYINHNSEKNLEEETWFNEQLNNLSKLNSKIAELTAYSHEPFQTSTTNITYDTFLVDTPTSSGGVTSASPPTILNGHIKRNSNKTFSKDDKHDDNDSSPSHSDSIHNKK